MRIKFSDTLKSLENFEIRIALVALERVGFSINPGSSLNGDEAAAITGLSPYESCIIRKHISYIACGKDGKFYFGRVQK